MSISSEFLTMLGVQDDFCIQPKEYTSLLVLLPSFLRCNGSSRERRFKLFKISMLIKRVVTK
ncbi:MAG: hypothetical protein BECKG1743F_GA0114225_100803 [Candidatus Kentron sp. G]|nr:MAG: hypothetical protein BECKG1743F_GA0114225_100803 [Candidatus Kentron sp. G]